MTIAFANMVGLSTLQAWDKDQAGRAFDAFAVVSKKLLDDAGGNLVELTTSGLCLAAFSHPLDAVAWGAGLVEVLKHYQWDEVRMSPRSGRQGERQRCSCEHACWNDAIRRYSMVPRKLTAHTHPSVPFPLSSLPLTGAARPSAM